MATDRCLILGVPTDVFHKRLKNGLVTSRDTVINRKTLHIFFIPGNPGTINFYIDFLCLFVKMLSLHSNFANYTEILIHGVSHANHHLEFSMVNSDVKFLEKYSEVYDLEFQICHTLEFVNSILKKDSAPSNAVADGDYDIMLMGHSIGAYMVLEMMRRIPNITRSTRHLLLLMPFISWSRLPLLHKIKLTSFIRLYPWSQESIVSLSQNIINMNPKLRKNIIQLFTGYNDSLLDTIADGLICKRIVENFFSMGAGEIIHVKKDEARNIKMLESLDMSGFIETTTTATIITPDNSYQHVTVEDRVKESDTNSKLQIFALFTDHDDWATLADANFLRTRLTRNTTVIFQKGLTHGFSLSEKTIELTLSLLQRYFSTLGFSKVNQTEYKSILKSRL